MKILKSQTLASCNTEDVMESCASVSNFTSPPMVLVRIEPVAGCGNCFFNSIAVLTSTNGTAHDLRLASDL